MSLSRVFILLIGSLACNHQAFAESSIPERFFRPGAGQNAIEGHIVQQQTNMVVESESTSDIAAYSWSLRNISLRYQHGISSKLSVGGQIDHLSSQLTVHGVPDASLAGSRLGDIKAFARYQHEFLFFEGAFVTSGPLYGDGASGSGGPHPEIEAGFFHNFIGGYLTYIPQYSFTEIDYQDQSSTSTYKGGSKIGLFLEDSFDSKHVFGLELIHLSNQGTESENSVSEASTYSQLRVYSRLQFADFQLLPAISYMSFPAKDYILSQNTFSAQIAARYVF